MLRRKGVYMMVLMLLAIAIICSVLTLLLLRTFMRNQIIRNAQLRPTSITFKQWKNQTFPTYFQVYLFNLTNPDDFRNGSKPVLKQSGPYTYVEKRLKSDIVFNTSSADLTYKELKQYFFQHNLSAGDESDILVNVNPVYIALNYKLIDLPSFVRKAIDRLEHIFGDQLIMKRSVGEWLWGYEDPFMSVIHAIYPSVEARVGLLVNKNGTDDGPIRINTGTTLPSELGKVISYRGVSSMSCWITQWANEINGTDGSFFHPFIDSTEKLYIFASQFCRSLEFVMSPQYTSTILFGIPCLKFQPSNESLYSPSENPGFCPHWPTCYGRGVLDLSTCQSGNPIAMSLPHFTGADEMYLNAVIGIQPSDDHRTALYIEPKTGMLIKAMKKFQINLNISQNSDVPSLTNISSVLLPIMFVNESFVLDQQSADTIRMSVLTAPTATTFLAIGILVFSVLAILVTTLVMRYGPTQFRLPQEVGDDTAGLLDAEPTFVSAFSHQGNMVDNINGCSIVDPSGDLVSMPGIHI